MIKFQSLIHNDMHLNISEGVGRIDYRASPSKTLDLRTHKAKVNDR